MKTIGIQLEVELEQYQENVFLWLIITNLVPYCFATVRSLRHLDVM